MTLKTTTYYIDFAEHLSSVWFRNEGSRIVETNYWNLPMAKSGICYLSGNAGNWRLLLPSIHREAAHEFGHVKRALIEPSINIAGHIDIVAIDGSTNPYCVCVDKTMIDRPLVRKRSRLLVYTEQGLINNVPLKICG